MENIIEAVLLIGVAFIPVGAFLLGFVVAKISNGGGNPKGRHAKGRGRHAK